MFDEEGSRDQGARLLRAANDVENRGVTPDVEVTISPEAHARGEDPQLDAAVAEALRLARERPPPPKPARGGTPETDAARNSAGKGRWPFKVFAPYPEEEEEEEEEDASESESESESDDESPPPRRKPKGARPRR